MSNNDTRKLYAEYRTAVRERDDKKAYTILKKITEADPKDTTARMQCEALVGKVIESSLTQLEKTRDQVEAKRILRELEGMFSEAQLSKYSEYVKAKGVKVKPSVQKGSERLKELRRSLREALLSQEKEKAFEFLEEICKIDASDRDAQQQKKETGKLLCSQYASEMRRLTRSGEMPGLSRLMDCMRRWGSAPILEQIEGYKAAEELVTQYQRHETEKEIARRLIALRADRNLTTKERYDEVREVERKAEKYAIKLQGEDATYVRSVKSVWNEEEKARKRKQVLAELGLRYTDIQNSLESISGASDQVLSEKLPLLDDILHQTAVLGDYPDVGEFSDSVLRKLADIRKELRRRKKRRQLKVFGKGVLSALVLFLVVLVGYACINAGSAIKDMKGIRDEIKNSGYTADRMAKLRVLTSSPPFGFGLTKLFLADHQVTFFECGKFVKHFDDLQERLASVLRQMRLIYADPDPGNPDTSKVREYVPLIRAAKSLRGELSEEYRYELSSEERQTVQDYEDNVVAMRARFLARYITPSTMATLSELEKLWLEYKDMDVVFAFNEEESKTIYAAFANAVRYILMCGSKPGGPGISDLRSSLELFDRYCESMELDGGLRDEIADILQKMEEFEGIDTKLSAALSLAEYMKIIDGFEASYFKVPGFYDYRPLKEWIGDGTDDSKLRDLVTEVMAKALHALPQKRECNRELYEQIKRIYEEDKRVYLEYRENTIGDAIDRITKDRKSEMGMWKKALRVAVDKGMVYPGGQFRINGTISVRLLDEYGNESGKVYRSKTVHGGRKLNFVDMREEIGFDSLSMLRGDILPTDLLRRTARERKNSAYPVMALAWLFDETIKLMEAYPEPLANGIALSPSLKNDIEEFKSLPGHAEIKKGCWLLPHRLDYENVLISFFAKCEGRDYKKEVLQNLNKILNAKLLYAGYIGQNGQRYILATYRGMNLYRIVRNQKNEPRLEPVTAHSELQRFTPVFVLK